MRQVRRAAEAGMSRQRSGGVRSRPEGAQSAGRPGVRLPDAGRGPAGKRSSWHGSGRWPTSPMTAPCPPAGTSAASMAGTSDGADWSNGQDWLANWTRRPSRRSDTPPDGALSVPTTGASSHAEDAGSHRRRSANSAHACGQLPFRMPSGKHRRCRHAWQDRHDRPGGCQAHGTQERTSATHWDSGAHTGVGHVSRGEGCEPVLQHLVVHDDVCSLMWPRP
jgi:hypothetical protein